MASDKAALQSFQCTTPLPRYRRHREPHPKPWEFELQVWIHSLCPPLEPGSVLYLGSDAEGLAAVAVWQDRGGGNFYFEALAIATRLRGGTGEHARHAVEVVLGVMEAAAVARGELEMTVSVRVHVKNRASQRLLASFGVTPEEDAQPDEHGYVEWYAYRDLRGFAQERPPE